MSEQKVKEIERSETRRFRYGNEESNISFDFEIEVSNPEIAIAEISDFIELLGQAAKDLLELKQDFANRINNPAKQKANSKKEHSDGPVEVEELPTTATK